MNGLKTREQARTQLLNGQEKEIIKKKGFFSKLMSFVSNLVILGAIVGLFLLYGPYSGFRDWYITTAMTTMTHQYLATWLYSDIAIQDSLNKNKIVEVNSVTDPSLIQENNTNVEDYNEYEKELLQKDPQHPEYNIIEIEGKGYSGFVAAVYDASKIHTLVTKKVGKSGQYITTMAKDNKAVLAINGGFFVDLKEDRTGGTPLGITISNGKVITSDTYTNEGGVVGFDNENKLILGKMSAKEAVQKNIRDCVCTGPFLIINGVASKIVGNGGWGTAPRTAIGQRKDGVVIFMVIDGRRVGKPGASMETLIELMQRYGAYNASALDGGTSSVMVENYELLNDPIDSDGRHKTRPVATGFGLILGEEDKKSSSE